jgi:organic hydroperoxide reductase OsmC/OhrA
MSDGAGGAGVKHKTFSYRTGLRWLGDRSGITHSEGKPDLRVASPPEFKGEAGVWTPEHLFVAAVELCTMATFISFAQHRNLDIVCYESSAEGTLEFVDESYQITRVVLRPRITVAAAASVPEAERTLRDAHRSCIIAHSIRSAVSIEPVIGMMTSEPRSAALVS